MPRHQEAMKDAATCEKPRGVGSELRSVDIRMGKPGRRHGLSAYTEYIGVRGERRELKHLSTSRKGNQRDSASSGERMRNSPNPSGNRSGLWGPTWDCRG
jgi:hypothetical protein